MDIKDAMQHQTMLHAPARNGLLYHRPMCDMRLHPPATPTSSRADNTIFLSDTSVSWIGRQECSMIYPASERVHTAQGVANT